MQPLEKSYICHKFCDNSIFGRIFFYATQEKVCHKFCDNSIFGRKFVFLMQHRQKFAINFVTTPFLVECFLFMQHRQRVAINFVTTAFLVEGLY